MVEMDLTDVVQGDKEQSKTHLQEVNAALKECGFGIFHVKLLLTSFMGTVSGMAVTTTTSYLLPTAECDLNMSLEQKGLLNAMPYMGMLFSSLIAGFLTDTFGRKIFIITGFSGLFLATFVSASSQTFNLLITAKFFEGMLHAISFSAALTITAEFCHNGIRDRVLICQSSFKPISSVIIAGTSWAILINDWHLSLFNDRFVLNTWNFYLYILSLCSLSACTLYLFIPESPKYLVTQKKFDKARAVLIKIYKTNTGNPVDKFGHKDLWKNSKTLTSEDQLKSSFTHHLVVGLHNTKQMFRKPLVVHLLLTCMMNFYTMALTLAVSIIMTVGRIGTSAGNISFPVLLKMGCVIPFYTLAGMMLCVAIMSVFLPTKRK